MREFLVERQFSEETADDLIGRIVDEQTPNVTQEGIWRDKDTGEPVLMHFPAPFPTGDVRRAVLRIHFGQGTYRSGMGFRNRSATFGYAPRKAFIQREACQPSALARDHPDIEAVLDAAASLIFDVVQRELPDVSRQAMDVIDREVLPEWRMESVPWTSGVINETSQLPYHRDGFNFPLWSAMPVLRRAVRGGHLHLPEYDLTVPCRDRWVVAFPGYRIVHGVTPMVKKGKGAYRISIVYYALRGMKDCHTYAVEVGEARKRRTEREDRALTDDDQYEASRRKG